MNRDDRGAVENIMEGHVAWNEMYSPAEPKNELARLIRVCYGALLAAEMKEVDRQSAAEQQLQDQVTTLTKKARTHNAQVAKLKKQITSLQAERDTMAERVTALSSAAGGSSED